MNSETIFLKAILNKSDLLKKAVIIEGNVWEKYFLLLATKLLKEITVPSNYKERYSSFLRRKTHNLKNTKIITQPLKAI